MKAPANNQRGWGATAVHLTLYYVFGDVSRPTEASYALAYSTSCRCNVDSVDEYYCTGHCLLDIFVSLICKTFLQLPAASRRLDAVTKQCCKLHPRRCVAFNDEKASYADWVAFKIKLPMAQAGRLLDSRNQGDVCYCQIPCLSLPVSKASTRCHLTLVKKDTITCL